MTAADPRSGPPLAEHELRAALAEGAALFDAGRHWHAHEAWEAAWHRAPAEERDFFRGLIHAAAALVHHAKGNAKGFDSQVERMHMRLHPYRTGHRQVDVEALLAAIDALPRPAGDPTPIAYPKLPRQGRV